MADNDLFTALNMLKSGVQQLQSARTIQGANDQVNQIRQSEQSDADKRVALTNLSHDLVGRLGALGLPLDQIQAQASAIAPPQYANADDMHRQALLTNNSDLLGESGNQQRFEEQPKLLDIRAAHEASAPLRQLLMDQKQNELFTKHTMDINNKIDPNTSRFGNIAKLQGSNNQIATMATMLNDPSRWTPTAMAETVRKLDSVLSQGASTVAGTQELMPKVLDKYKAEFQQLLTNRPQPMAGALAWQNYYKDTFDRIQNVNQNLIKESQLSAVQGDIPGLLRQFPAQKGDPETAFSNKIGEPVVIDPVTKNVDLKSNVDTQDQYAQAIQQAAKNPSDPRVGAVLNQIAGDTRNVQRTLLRYPQLRGTWGKLKSQFK